jgi:hypothetical protein
LFAVFWAMLLFSDIGTSILSAQQETSVTTDSTASYSYGQVMNFTLVANAPNPVTSVTLYVQATELANTLTAEIDAGSMNDIDVTREVDLTQIRLAPFTKVTYWWSIEVEGGDIVETERKTLDYIDDQFDWQKNDRDGIEIYWSSEDQAIGQIAWDSVDKALGQIETMFDIPQPDPLKVFVYPSAADLRAGLRLTGRDWVGAHARPQLGVILVAANGSLTSAEGFSQDISHELAHLYLYESTGNAYETAPRWFDEGMATLIDGAPNSNLEMRLDEAVAQGETLDFAELCYTFPTDEEQALLAYAQSAALLRYIQSEYGTETLKRMIAEMAAGADCQSMVLRTMGISLSELNEEWLQHELPQSLFQRVWQNGRAWLVVLAAGFLLVGYLAGLPKGLRRRS